MAENRDPKTTEKREGYDPEFEMPDPEQVDQDIEDAEERYGEDDNKKPAA